jgi:hypothetical protein
LVEQRTLNPLADSSSLSWPTINDSAELHGLGGAPMGGEPATVCTYVCTPLDEVELERRIADAELAGRTTVADALARCLERLRGNDCPSPATSRLRRV